jgi:hypothetical protein
VPSRRSEDVPRSGTGRRAAPGAAVPRCLAESRPSGNEHTLAGNFMMTYRFMALWVTPDTAVTIDSDHLNYRKYYFEIQTHTRML